MGRDINLSLVSRKGEYLLKDFYDGRNYEWFNDLTSSGYREEYDYLPFHYGLPENYPIDYDELNKESEDDEWLFYVHKYHIKVKDFIDWFTQYKPHIDAGWVSTRDMYMYKNKDIYPTDKIAYYLSEDDNIQDMQFGDFIDEKDSSLWLFNQVKDADEESYLIYYFY